MFDLPPQELCQQAFNRQKSMIFQLPPLSSTLWNAINLCFISTPLFDHAKPFGPTSPDYDPRHYWKSTGAWRNPSPSFTSRCAPLVRVSAVAYTALLADVRNWESRNAPYYHQELCRRRPRLAALVRVSGRWKISRWACWEMEEARSGLAVYEEWKEEDGEGVRVCGELLEEGLKIVERGMALLEEAGVRLELSGEEGEEGEEVLLKAESGGGDAGVDGGMRRRGGIAGKD